MGHPRGGSQTGINWRDKDATEITVMDRGRDYRQDRGEVARGAEAASRRPVVAAFTHAGFVANARAMAADAIGARSRSPKERERE